MWIVSCVDVLSICKGYVKTIDALAVDKVINISLEWSKKVYYRLSTADDVINSFIHMFDNAGCRPMMAWLWTTLWIVDKCGLRMYKPHPPVAYLILPLSLIGYVISLIDSL